MENSINNSFLKPSLRVWSWWRSLWLKTSACCVTVLWPAWPLTRAEYWWVSSMLSWSCGTREVERDWGPWTDTGTVWGQWAWDIAWPSQAAETRLLCSGTLNMGLPSGTVICSIECSQSLAKADDFWLGKQTFSFIFPLAWAVLFMASSQNFQTSIKKWSINTNDSFATRELKHSLDVRSVYLNNKVIITTDDLKDIYIWDLESGHPDRYQRRKDTCIRQWYYFRISE